MRKWTFPERRPPGDGPWTHEPDKAQWVDGGTGLDCLIVRSASGALCGYVGVPPDHPWHGMDFGMVPVGGIHGGLTFSGPCQDDAEDGPEVCHVPEPGRPADVWWLGFDCAHAGDLAPTVAAELRVLGIAVGGDYRSFGYVFAEVCMLAAMAARAAVQS
jgi:hypothetical protein